MAIPWGELAIAAGSIISNWLTNKKNEDITEKGMQWQENMMDKQNEYNDPSNQVARLMSAGLNPNLAGSSLANTSAGVGNPQLFPYQDIFSSFGNNSLALMNARKSREEGTSEQSLRDERLKNIKNQNELFLKQIDSLDISNANQRVALQYADSLYQWNIKNQKATFDLNYAERAKANAIIKQMEYELKNVLPEQVQKLVAERKLNYAQIEEVSALIVEHQADVLLKGSQAKLNQEQALTEVEKQNQIKQEAGLTEQQKNYYSVTQNAYLEKFDAEINKLKAESGLTEQESYWYLFHVLDENTNKFFGAKMPELRGKSYRKLHREALEFYSPSD